MLFGGLLWLGFWLTIVYFFVRGLGTLLTRRGPEEALEIAKRRYAGGEITKEEFETIRRLLVAEMREGAPETVAGRER
jgi:uncharacterized membrane protein